MLTNAVCRSSSSGSIGARAILAYGFERDFLEIWIIKDGNTVTGVLAKFYDDVTLLCSENADTEQLRAFIGMFISVNLCVRLSFAKHWT